MTMWEFTAKLEIIGINPFVFVPEHILAAVKAPARKNKGPKLVEALTQNKQAKERFDALAPYLQKEIVRYISFLKTAASVERNVAKAIDFLLGNGPFIGRKMLE